MSLGFAVDLFLNPIIFVEEGLTSARAMHPEMQHNSRNDAPALIYIALAMGAPACRFCFCHFCHFATLCMQWRCT